MKLYNLTICLFQIFEEAGMPNLLEKQYLLTGYLEHLLNKKLTNKNLSKAPSATIITPADPNQRGCQLSLEFSFDLQSVHDLLQKHGVVVSI